MTTPTVHKTGHNHAATMTAMRAQGSTYRHIRAALKVSYRDVEAVLGEGAQLRAEGFSHVDIGLLVGMPAGSVARLWKRPDPGHGRGFAATIRDMHALGGLVQQRAMQVDVLAEFLGIGTSHVYELIARLTDAEMLHPLMAVGAGPKWVVPTRAAGARVLGYRPKGWKPSRLWSIHGRAAAQARIALGATAFDAWESERQLRTRNSYRGAYPYDGRVAARDNLSQAVKVLVAPHPTRAQLMRTITTAGVQAHRDQCAHLLIVCAGPDVDATTRAARDSRRDNLSHLPDLHITVKALADLNSEHRSPNQRGNRQ